MSRFYLVTATALLLWLGPQAWAESGISNTVSGVTSNASSTYRVRTNGAFNAMIVTNAGVLTATGCSTIGNDNLFVGKLK